MYYIKTDLTRYILLMILKEEGDLSMQIEMYSISANFNNLIEILAKDLYSNKEIFIRELIQNGHDSIIRREYFQNARLSSKIRKITIRTNSQNKTVVFEDFGIGMNRNDILEFLSVIGSSGTKKAQLELKDQGIISPDLIGHFGIGMLSAFAVAHKIEIETRKEGEDEAFLWRSVGTQDFELIPIFKEYTGTRVTVYLKSDYFYFAEDPDSISDVVAHYCEFVPIPIYLNDDSAPLNLECAPWNIKNPGSRIAQCEGFARMHFGYQILDSFFFDASIESGCDLNAKGIIVINHKDQIEASGYVDLYINNMLVCSKTKGLLPEWATFISAAIECPDIMPTTSRSEIVENKKTTLLRQILEKKIIDRLQKLPKINPDIFENIIKVHDKSIKELASNDILLFQEVCLSLIFDTNKGHLSLNYCKNFMDRGYLYYLKKDLAMSAQYAQIADANGYFYFWIYDGVESILLQKFSASQGLSFCNLIKTCEEDMLKKLEESKLEDFYPLCERFNHTLQQKQISATTEIREFLPESLPALIQYQNNIDAKLNHHFIKNLRDGQIWSSILPDELHGDMEDCCLVLNALNSTICRLLSYNDDSELLYTCIFYNALLRAKPVSPVTMLTIRECMENLIQAFLKNSVPNTAAAEVVQDFVSISSLPASIHSLPKKDWIRLFLIIPYDEEYAVLEQAIRNVFECEPYFYEVVIANKNIREGGYLLSSLRKNMEDTDGYIAEITERNANVMMEVGAVLIENSRKPFFPLEASEIKEQLQKKDYKYKGNIADFGDKLKIKYRTFLLSEGMSVKQLEHEIETQIRGALLNHGRLAHEDIISLEKLKKRRFLSYTFLNKILGSRFNESEKDLLCATYNTLEELSNATDDYSGIGQEAFAYIKSLLANYIT